MKPKLGSHVMRLLLTSLICLLVAGCTSMKESTFTGRLWDGETMVDLYKPAPAPNIKLYQRGNGRDVLVQYDEEQEQSGLIRRRAYFLSANAERVEQGKKPHFVQADLAAGMEPIPIKTPTDNKVTTALCVKLFPDKNSFILMRDGKEEGEFNLPVYANKITEAARLLLLTPATVAVDAAIAGTVVGVMAAYAYAQGSH